MLLRAEALRRIAAGQRVLVTDGHGQDRANLWVGTQVLASYATRMEAEDVKRALEFESVQLGGSPQVR